MASADTPLPTGVVVRKLALTVVGVFLFAASLTVVFEGMRAVMDVGGYCASGGPYEIRQECPDGAGLIVAGIFGGLIGTGLVVAGTFRGGPKLYAFAWPALFLSLGWNFLEYGIDPPPPEDGLVWGWLICAVAFLAMGGIPLLFVLWNAKLVLWGTSAPVPSATSSPPPSLRSMYRTFGRPDAPQPSYSPQPSYFPQPPPPPRDPVPEDDLVTDLERLAALHRDGHLTDAEYARAKSARLAEEGA